MAPRGVALLTALIGAVIMICGSDCREAVRVYLQLIEKRACSQINDLPHGSRETWWRKYHNCHLVLDVEHAE